jgi:hypothetical protein
VSNSSGVNPPATSRSGFIIVLPGAVSTAFYFTVFKWQSTGPGCAAVRCVTGDSNAPVNADTIRPQALNQSDLTKP